ncbi:MAG: hypothetical protein ACOX7K_08260 [Oscillospiraceae bacterium]|jgi:hypothetical protein
MKRTLSLLLCLLLVIGNLLALSACSSKTDSTDTSQNQSTETQPALEDADYYSYYYIYDDLPAIEKSDAAYLLDLDFTVTPDNFADCMDHYFSAPAVLYFWPTFHTDSYRAMNNSEKASAFSVVFRDVSFLSISQEEYPDYQHYEEQYDIMNAIGTLQLRLWQGETYISFYREGNVSGYDETYSRVEGDLISAVNSVGESLKDDSVEVPGFEPPH